MNRERIFVAWVSDRPGVLTRIASVFFRRSINIVSLNVASTHTPRVSKMVIRAAGDEHELLRVKRQISRLVDTLRVDVLSTDTAVLDELCFARVRIENPKAHDELLTKMRPYGCHVVRVDQESIVLSLTSTPTTIDHFLAALEPHGVIDISRTGATAAPLADAPLDGHDLRTSTQTIQDLLRDEF